MDGGLSAPIVESSDSSSMTLSLPLRVLAERITELAGHLNAANAQWLSLIAEFDRRTGWSDGATRSCAHWLSWKCGLGLGAAREKLRVAHALEDLPQVRAAMARGALSYSKVRALTRVADAGTEAMLLDIALHGTASHVENVVRHFRRACEAAELSRVARQFAGRRVSWFHDDDGSLLMSVRLPAEAGALLVQAIERAVAEGEEVPAETTPAPLGMRRADALAQVAESFLAHGLAAMNGGDRHQIVVHVDAETLQGSDPAGSSSCCELEHGPAIPAETLRRLACDSSVVRIVENGRGEPLDVGRRTRSVPPALRRALQSRDRGCRFPGCPHTRYVDAHHLRHWAHGGETRLSNLVTLCRFHHRAVHEGGVRIQILDDGALRFTDSRGNVCALPDPPSGSVVELRRAHEASGLHIDASTAAGRWGGERIDYDLAVHALMCRRNRRSSSKPSSRQHPPPPLSGPARLSSRRSSG